MLLSLPMKEGKGLKEKGATPLKDAAPLLFIQDESLNYETSMAF